MRVQINRGVLLAAALALPAEAATSVAKAPGAAIATAADASTVLAPPAGDGFTPARVEMPARAIALSIGSGQLIRLPRAISSMFIADEKIADVNVKSPTQVYLFGKGAGETSVYATDKSGAVVWSSSVRVGNNIGGVAGILRTTMPEQDITATTLASNVVLLTGTVLSPKDGEEAQHIAELYLGKDAQVINHLKVATPQQVSLQVKIAEVSRSVARDIGVNIANRGSGTLALFQGNPGTITTNNTTAVDAASGAQPGQNIATFVKSAFGTTLGLAGHAFGTDIISTLNLAEQDGLVTTLAEPTLVALSGETASFLAGGEIPIPQAQGLGAVSVEFKQYGVSLSFTPTVMSDGRISIRVRPEVSQLSDSGSVKLNGFVIPALTTRRVDTTIELGSGQSFVIGGLLQNNHNNSVDKAPILGDLPVLGTLFRSNSFRKQETELVVVVTPYIVKPVDAAKIALPTDGYRSATTFDRVVGGRLYDAAPGATRPMPMPVTPAPSAPVGAANGSQH